MISNDRYLDPPECDTMSNCDRCGVEFDNDDLLKSGIRWLCVECFDKENEMNKKVFNTVKDIRLGQYVEVFSVDNPDNGVITAVDFGNMGINLTIMTDNGALFTYKGITLDNIRKADRDVDYLPKYPEIEVELPDGNAFAVIGAVRKAMQVARVPSEERQQYFEESISGDYDHLLAVAQSWVTIK